MINPVDNVSITSNCYVFNEVFLFFGIACYDSNSLSASRWFLALNYKLLNIFLCVFGRQVNVGSIPINHLEFESACHFYVYVRDTDLALHLNVIAEDFCCSFVTIVFRSYVGVVVGR